MLKCGRLFRAQATRCHSGRLCEAYCKLRLCPIEPFGNDTSHLSVKKQKSDLTSQKNWLQARSG